MQEIIKNQQDKFCTFQDLKLVADASAFYPSLEPLYNTGNLPFLRVADVNTVINYDSAVHIPDHIFDEFKTLKTVKHGDIVLTKGGSVARSGYIDRPCAVSRDLIFINSSKMNEYESIFLFCYLMTDFANKLLLQSSSMTAQPHLTLTLVKNLPIFNPNDELKSKIANLYILSKQKLEESKKFYVEAEEILLSELGLNDFTLSNESIAIKSFSESFGSSGRLDSEYYQLKYDYIEKKVKTKAVYVNEIKNIKIFNARGSQPIYIENGSLDVINSRHILENGLDYDNFEKTDISYWESQEKAQIFKNDILIYTTGANIGRTATYLINKPALASNHVNILRIKNENPVYVSFVLNSIIGRLQTEKLSAGSAQQELYPKDIDNFYIPFIDQKKQNDIEKKVIQSFEIKAESKRLLEEAKIAVETAIKVGE
ncbi:MAG: restriction endonuclease subunit S [Campylobacterota bacterium]